MSDMPVLEAHHISKRFPGVLANDQVNLSLHRGEILALLGENGAGKSTLMNILYGLYQPDGGEIRVHGQPVRLRNSRQAIDLGIGMVHQHFQLVPVFTVAENVILGLEITKRGGRLDSQQAAQQVETLSKQYGLPIDPTAIVESLPVGLQQRVEIIKALYRQADILILDEPTAVLTPQEVDELFTVMQGLAAQGKSIIFISHKLKEVLTISHRILVMRGGQTVGETTPDQATAESLAAMMVGREVMLQVEKSAHEAGETVLAVEALTAKDNRQRQVLNGLSLTIRADEILGVAGVQGNGQTELVEVLTGLRPPTSGQVSIAGAAMTGRSPRQFTEQGVGHIPEDRQRFGLVKPYPISDNLVLNSYYRPPFTQRLTMQPRAIRQRAVELIERFDIRTPSPETHAGSLSGGNQQKMVVAREVGGRENKLLIASQPTRGVDVGSIEFIHQQLIAQRDAGVAVLLVSAELDEILALSDRIAVMYEGRIVATLDATEASREQLGLLMAGSVG